MPPILGVVAVVANTIVGVAAGIGSLLVSGGIVGSLISSAISLGMSLLNKPKTPPVSQENVNRLRANVDVRAPRKTVVGTTALATDIRDEEFTGSNQDYMHRFIVCASHKVHAVNEIWFDDKQAWTLAGGVQGEFVGYLDVDVVLEGSSGSAINISARMGSTRRYTGLAYVHLKYKLTGNDSKVDSPFAQSVTTRITIRGEGAALYDPRMDSTVAGGSGSQRADDQTTWVWDDNACNNPALAMLFYLLGYKINGLLAVGKGIPKERIDLESFAIAANICDESVTKTGGGTEPRYRCAGVWSEGDNPTTVLEMLKSTMNADLDDVDGKLRLTIFTDDGFSSDADFTDDDLIGPFEWQQSRPLDESFNVVRGTYTDPSDQSLYQQVDYPQVDTTSPDGIDRIFTLDLPMAESVGQCQRLASLRLNRETYSGTFKAEFQATAWRVQKNSIVRLTFTPLGWTNKTFRVAEMDLRVDGVVPLTLVEEDPNIYVAPALVYGVDGTDSTPYDPSKNPIIDAITSTGLEGYLTTPSASVATASDGTGGDYTDAGGTFVLNFIGEPVTSGATFAITATTGGLHTSGTPNVAIDSSTGVYTITGCTTDQGTATFSATYNGQTITKKYTIAKALGGVIGTSPVNASLSRPALGLFAYADGTVVSFANANGQFTLMQGGVDVTASATFSASASGCTGTVNTATDTPVAGKPKGYYQVTAMSSSEASLTITATYGGIDYILVFSLTKTIVGYEIVTSLPASNLFQGRVVFLTTDNKLYRYTGSAWVAAVAASDVTGTLTNSQIADLAAAKITGQITTTQITDSSISTAKLAAASITTAKIAASAITASEIAAGAITTPKIDAGAVTANEIASNAVTTNKINAGAVTAAKIAVTQLDALSATIGTLRTSSSGARVEIKDNVIKVYDASNVLRVKIGDLSL